MEKNPDKIRIGELCELLEEQDTRIATLETQLAEALKYGAVENYKALSYVKNPCKKHNEYWTTVSGACMACRAVNAETQLAAANEAVRVLAKRVCVSEKYHAALITHKKPSDLDGVREELWKTIADVLNNPLARASVEKAGKQ